MNQQKPGQSYKWRGIEREAGEKLKGPGIRLIDLKGLQDDEIVLKNPHKGLYHHYIDNWYCEGKPLLYGGTEQELLNVEGLTCLFIRMAWAHLEPAEGKYRWDIIDRLVERWYDQRGIKFVFSITCKETSKDQIFATPRWVMEAGAKGEYCRPWPHSDFESWTPDYGDPVFLDKLENFHRAFSSRYGGKPFVEEIVIASIGEWGEGHSSFSNHRFYPVEVVKRHIDLYLRCYPNNRIHIGDDYLTSNCRNDEEREALLDYLVENRVGMRDDPVLVDWYIKHYPDTYTVRSPHYFSRIAPVAPTTLETSHYSMMRRGGDWAGQDGEETGAQYSKGAMDLMHPSFVSMHGYVRFPPVGDFRLSNTELLELEGYGWADDNPRLLKELANKAGYWYFADSVALPEKVQRGSDMKFRIRWVNRGVTRAYQRFSLLVKLEGENTVILSANGSNNENWLAYQATNEVLTVPIPLIANGKYMLKSKLEYTDPWHRTTDVKLAFRRNILDNDGFYELAPVEVCT